MGRLKRGLSDVKTAQKARLRSRPRAAGSRLLELYLLTKEKNRLEQHKEVIDKKNKDVEYEVKDVEEEMERVADGSSLYELTHESELGGRGGKPGEKPEEKGRADVKRADVKKMTLDY
jgi:hypothetical protein